MRMIEQGERAEREAENQLTKIINRGNHSVDGYIPEVDEPSFIRSLPSKINTPSLPKPIPAPVPVPALTVVQAAAPALENYPAPKAERIEPEDYIPEDWTAEEEAIYQQVTLEEEKRIAQQLKNPNPSSNEATPQKKAA
jgi:hypothetical protein